MRRGESRRDVHPYKDSSTHQWAQLHTQGCVMESCPKQQGWQSYLSRIRSQSAPTGNRTRATSIATVDLFWCNVTKRVDVCSLCYANLSLRPLRGQFVVKLQAFGLPLRCRNSAKGAGLRPALWRGVPREYGRLIYITRTWFQRFEFRMNTALWWTSSQRCRRRISSQNSVNKLH